VPYTLPLGLARQHGRQHCAASRMWVCVRMCACHNLSPEGIPAAAPTYRHRSRCRCAKGRAQVKSRCRCQRCEPSQGKDVGRGEPVPVRCGRAEPSQGADAGGDEPSQGAEEELQDGGEPSPIAVPGIGGRGYQRKRSLPWHGPHHATGADRWRSELTTAPCGADLSPNPDVGGVSPVKVDR
jgi:hypothetical protein